MSRSIRTSFPVTGDRVVNGTIELPPSGIRNAPVLLFVPGFKGFRDWGGWPWLTRAIADAGFVVHRVDLSMNGYSGRCDLQDEEEKFAHNTFGHDLEDLDVLFDSFDRWGIPNGVASERFGIIGHSRGGIVSLLFAGEHPSIESVATLGAPACGLSVYKEELHDLWRESGSLEVINARTDQTLRLDVSILEDLEENRERYDVERAVKEANLPTLVLHGSEDETVSLTDAVELMNWLPNPRSRIEALETGHTFGFMHPFAGPDRAGEAVRDLLVQWFTDTLADDAGDDWGG
ncbi:MAG: alpha/beta hydrolase family protein [Planctomycetota bacterium]|jgi:pimeloyl-ACP methyl ester carboxylesterase